MKKYLITLLAGLLVLGAATARAQQEDLDAQYATRLIKEGQAPAFTLPGTDGKTYTLKDFKGKTVILDFWATWCPDCRNEMPQLKALQKYVIGPDGNILLATVVQDKVDALVDALLK